MAKVTKNWVDDWYYSQDLFQTKKEILNLFQVALIRRVKKLNGIGTVCNADLVSTTDVISLIKGERLWRK